MKLAALALAAVVTSAATFAPATADACAMRKVRLPQIEMVADTHFKKGEQAEAKGDMRTAIRFFERAMNAEGAASLRATAALRAANLHDALGNTDRAIARLTRGVALDGTHFDVRFALARKLMQRDVAAALPHLEAARDINRLAAAVYPELAIVRAKLGQTEAARRDLITAKGLGADPARVTEAEAALTAGGVAVL